MIELQFLITLGLCIGPWVSHSYIYSVTSKLFVFFLFIVDVSRSSCPLLVDLPPEETKDSQEGDKNLRNGKS